MKITIRKSTTDDYNDIYNLHIKCFDRTDQWYKTVIRECAHNGYVICTETKIIGVLLYSKILPCCETETFIPENNMGKDFLKENKHHSNIDGITMLCVHPKFRNKGFAQKLIKCYEPKEVCLNTRRSNPAYNLYIKMGYSHIGTIKEKYFLPTEDSMFMYKLN